MECDNGVLMIFYCEDFFEVDHGVKFLVKEIVSEKKRGKLCERESKRKEDNDSQTSSNKLSKHCHSSMINFIANSNSS